MVGGAIRLSRWWGRGEGSILHFQVFGQAHLMTNGGPNDTTQVLVRYIYQTAFRDSELGRASVMAVFLFVTMGGFSILQFVLGREGD